MHTFHSHTDIWVKIFCRFLNREIWRRLFQTYLHNEDLWFSNEGLALVSFEHGRDVLDADLAVVRVNVIVFAVAQEGEQKAVGVRMIGLGSWRSSMSVVNLLNHQRSFHIQD